MTTKKKPANNVPALTTYYMYITGGCNLACRHCWISPTYEKDGGSGECLDFDLYKIAIEEGIPLGLKQIKFTGGEPLLHPDFIKMADYATEKKIRTWMETNGTLLTAETAYYLKNKTSLNFVSVSLDGAVASTNDGFRNVQGSFDRAIEGIEFLVKAGYKPQIIMSLCKENLQEIEAMVKIVRKMGCASLKFNVIQSSGRGEKLNRDEELLSIDKLIALGRWIEFDLQKKHSFPLLFSWPMAFHSIRRLQIDYGANCGIFNILGILASGEIALCGIGTQEKDLIYGRLGKNKIGNIWENNLRLKKMRKLIPTSLEGICGQCVFKNRCFGTCIAQNYHLERRLTAPFWFCRDAAQKKLFPVNKYLT